MASNNILLIIIILLIIGIVVYFYYNYKNSDGDMEDNKVIIDNKSSNNYLNSTTVTNLSPEFVTKRPQNKTAKRVRFNDNVKKNIYKNSPYKKTDTSTSPYLSPSILSLNSKYTLTSPDRKINVDNIFASETSPGFASPKNLINVYSDQSYKVKPMNLEEDDPETMWDSSFGLPLMSKDEKMKFVSKMQKEHHEYQKSMGEFVKYQTDDSIVIKNDTTIDPFKEENRCKTKGKTIKDIYDEQVVGPKAKPKKIKYKTANVIVYDDESELNGGRLKGTNLSGFEGGTDGSTGYKTAAFGNEF